MVSSASLLKYLPSVLGCERMSPKFEKRALAEALVESTS